MNAPRSVRSAALAPTELARIASILRADAGIEIPEGKASLVEARLTRRLRETGVADYSAYCALLEGPNGAVEREHMLSALTTNVTKFFREGHHFEDLKTRVLPPLLARASKGDTVRFWSAACSSGEEPYSIAMTILAADPRATDYDIRVLATDIDPRMVVAGRRGIYRKNSIMGVNNAMMSRWFDKVDNDRIQIRPALRKMVTFNRLNLHADWPMKRQIDVVFCRNVVIYFDKTHEARLWTRMVASLAPGGHIYVGHSERIPSELRLPVTLDGVTTYRKTSAPSQD